MLIWAGGILFFGFGDTLTSLMVFQSQGSEANVLLRSILSVVGPTVFGFLAVKVVATLAVLLLSRWQPSLSKFAGLATLVVGMFLVAQNATTLLIR